MKSQLPDSGVYDWPLSSKTFTNNVHKNTNILRAALFFFISKISTNNIQFNPKIFSSTVANGASAGHGTEVDEDVSEASQGDDENVCQHECGRLQINLHQHQ